jgi:hypothetical protein
MPIMYARNVVIIKKALSQAIACAAECVVDSAARVWDCF